MNAQDEDRIKAELYQEFYKINYWLFRKDFVEYIEEQTRWVDKKFLERSYNLNGEIKKDDKKHISGLVGRIRSFKQ